MSEPRTLRNLKSVGPATRKDLALLGISTVEELAGHEPDELYRRLCQLTEEVHDICVLDVFACAIAQARDPDLPLEQRDWAHWSRLRKSAGSGDAPGRSG